MKTSPFLRVPLLALCVLGCGWPLGSSAQSAPEFSRVQRTAGRDIALTLSGQSGGYYQIDVASNLLAWSALVTVASGAASSLQYTDSAAPFLETRYYRAQQLTGTNVFVGDHLSTTNGDVIIQPREHATFLLSWQDKTIYVDPTNSVIYSDVPKADLILVTHAHADHLNTSTINAIRGTNAVIVAPQDVYNQLTAAQKLIAKVLGYGGSTNLLGLDIQAVPAYNSYHPFGTANAYVLTIGGQRIFTVVPRVEQKKCWIEAVALPQGRDEKQTNQSNTVQAEHPAADLQSHSRARSI